MKVLVTVLVLGFLFAPAGVGAENSCSTEGYSVVFINGVFTDEGVAESGREALKKKFDEISARSDVEIHLAHNPTHANIAGFGLSDLIQSVAQSLGTSIGVVDRNYVLNQIQQKVSTQKILLVGHSQGTFYTNEIYRYLIDHGYPEESLGIYNVATPAHYVADEAAAGAGDYLTSSNDGVIAAVREAARVAKALAEEQRQAPLSVGILGSALPNAETIIEPLPANVAIPYQASDPEEEGSTFSGHAFGGVYLAGASLQIVSEINAALDELSIETAVVAEDGCFDPPETSLSSLGEEGLLLVTDAAADILTFGISAIVDTGNVIVSTGNAVAQSLANAFLWGIDVTQGAYAYTEENLSAAFGIIGDNITEGMWQGDGVDMSAELFAILSPITVEKSVLDPRQGTQNEQQKQQSEPVGEVLGEEDIIEQIEEIIDEIVGEESFSTDPVTEEGSESDESVENQGEEGVSGGTETVDKPGITGPDTMQNQGNSDTENENVPEDDENQGESEEEEAVVPEFAGLWGAFPGGWGIKTSGAGRTPLYNPVANQSFGPVQATLQSDDAAGSCLSAPTMAVSGHVFLIVWTDCVDVDVEGGGTARQYTLFGVRYSATGARVDDDVLVLYVPGRGESMTTVQVGASDTGFLVSGKITIAGPDGSGGLRRSDAFYIVVPRAGEPDADKSVVTQYPYTPSNNVPTVLDVVWHPDGTLVFFESSNRLNAVLYDEDAVEIAVDSIMSAQGKVRISSLNAICFKGDRGCMVVWQTRYGIRAVQMGRDLKDWRLGGCGNFYSHCPGLLVADASDETQFFSGIRQIEILGDGSYPAQVLITWYGAATGIASVVIEETATSTPVIIHEPTALGAAMPSLTPRLPTPLAIAGVLVAPNAHADEYGAIYIFPIEEGDDGFVAGEGIAVGSDDEVVTLVQAYVAAECATEGLDKPVCLLAWQGWLGDKFGIHVKEIDLP